MAWYLNRALTNLRNEVNAQWPSRDKTSDGTIGDLLHQNTTSDHNPDRDGSVDAWDMDIDGVDVWKIINQFEKHEASRYWIYDRQIASRSNNWKRERYTGSNPHDKHVHFNTREGYEDSNKPWGIKEDDVTVEELMSAPIGLREDEQVKWSDKDKKITLQAAMETLLYYQQRERGVATAQGKMISDLTALVRDLSQRLAQVGNVPESLALMESIDQRLDRMQQEFTAEVRDAVADLGEGGSAQVRADTE